MDENEPRNVKELLVEAKDASELLVDVAYAAVFFNDEDMADEVEKLEERMAGYLRRLRTLAILAARSPEDAEAIESVLWIASAIDKIGDAASDIARVVAAKLGIPDALRADLRHADEVCGRVKVREGSQAVGATLRDLSLPTETGMWVLAIRRGDDWEFDPGPESVVSEGDVLLYQGPEEGVNLIRAVAGAPPLPLAPETDAPPLSELDRAVDILVEMKNSSEAAVGLAYSSLLFNDRALAAEVATLEARSDVLHDELESWVLRASPEARNPDDLRGLLRLGAASEAVSDAAREMTWYVEHGEELHPVILMALEETEETGAETVVEAGSTAAMDLSPSSRAGLRGGRSHHRRRPGGRGRRARGSVPRASTRRRVRLTHARHPCRGPCPPLACSSGRLRLPPGRPRENRGRRHRPSGPARDPALGGRSRAVGRHRFRRGRGLRIDRSDGAPPHPGDRGGPAHLHGAGPSPRDARDLRRGPGDAADAHAALRARLLRAHPGRRGPGLGRGDRPGARCHGRHRRGGRRGRRPRPDRRDPSHVGGGSPCDPGQDPCDHGRFGHDDPDRGPGVRRGCRRGRRPVQHLGLAARSLHPDVAKAQVLLDLTDLLHLRRSPACQEGQHSLDEQLWR